MPSGEACTEELLVVSCVLSGDMIGEAWRELEVVTEEALIAEAGIEGVEVIEGRKFVWTLLGFVRRKEDDLEEVGFIAFGMVASIVGVARRGGLEEFEVIVC